MITRAPDKNTTERYQTLFAKANEALTKASNVDGEIQEITNLNEYFQALPALVQLKNGKYFTILPLDEPVFEINADTRNIKIPDELKNAGVAGDWGAEILYFLIDRYFDAQDFGASNMKVGIEWRIKNTDGETVDGISNAYLTDLTMYKDKVLVGWPLAGAITEQAGVVEFSVRFYEIIEDENGKENIAYSFSTLPAKITISKTLNLDVVNEEPYDINDEVLKRIKRMSSPSVGGGVDIQLPEYLVNLENSTYNPNLIQDSGELYTPGDYWADLSANGKLALYVQAYSPNAGQITYDWQKYNGENNWIDLSANGPENTFMVITADEERVPGKTYYTKTIEAGAEAYVRYIGNDLSNAGQDLYEKLSTYSATVAGVYRAKATNTVSGTQISNYSYSVAVPYPDIPNVSIVGESSVIINKDESIELKLNIANPQTPNYQWYQDGEEVSNESVYTITATNEDMDVEITAAVTNNRNNASITSDPALCKWRVSKPALIPQLESTSNLNAVLGNPIQINIKSTVPTDETWIKWYVRKQSLNENGDVIYTPEFIEGTEKEVKDFVSQYTPTNTGFYYAEIYNIRNGDTSNVLRVPTANDEYFGILQIS